MNSPLVGPQAGGKGYSAYFEGNQESIITHKEIYNSPELTITFWMFIIND